MLALNVRVGDVVAIGDVGRVRVDAKSGQAVRLVFDMPISIIIRILDHRTYETSFGLKGEARAPLKYA